MFLATASTKRPIAMTCLLIALVALGLNSYRKLSLEDLPAVGIPYVTVALYRDTNGNGQLDAGEPAIATATTDSSGNFGGCPSTTKRLAWCSASRCCTCFCTNYIAIAYQFSFGSHTARACNGINSETCCCGIYS